MYYKNQSKQRSIQYVLRNIGLWMSHILEVQKKELWNVSCKEWFNEGIYTLPWRKNKRDIALCYYRWDYESMNIWHSIYEILYLNVDEVNMRLCLKIILQTYKGLLYIGKWDMFFCIIILNNIWCEIKIIMI